MEKLYVNQTNLTIELETFLPLPGAQQVFIVTKNPNGVKREFTAVIEDAVKGIIKYSVLSVNDFSVPGPWTVWAKTIDSQGLTAFGQPSILEFHEQGT